MSCLVEYTIPSLQPGGVNHNLYYNNSFAIKCVKLGVLGIAGIIFMLLNSLLGIRCHSSSNVNTGYSYSTNPASNSSGLDIIAYGNGNNATNSGRNSNGSGTGYEPGRNNNNRQINNSNINTRSNQGNPYHYYLLNNQPGYRFLSDTYDTINATRDIIRANLQFDL